MLNIGRDHFFLEICLTNIVRTGCEAGLPEIPICKLKQCEGAVMIIFVIVGNEPSEPRGEGRTAATATRAHATMLSL